jgi:hypothetical protein
MHFVIVFFFRMPSGFYSADNTVSTSFVTWGKKQNPEDLYPTSNIFFEIYANFASLCATLFAFLEINFRNRTRFQEAL